MFEQDQSQRKREDQRSAARGRWFRRRWFVITVSIVFGGLITLFCFFEYELKHSQPILRQRVIDNLSQRFQSPVELADFRVSLIQGMEVSGTDLRIMNIMADDPNAADAARLTPMLTVHHFRFHLSVRDLFRHNVYLSTVYVQGLKLDLPPKRHFIARTTRVASKDHYVLMVDKIVCTDTILTLETAKPGKVPLVFDIANLTLHDIGPGKPSAFDATLVNPKPVGDIHSTGYFGPWKVDDPRETPISGDYSFTHADLNTIKGINGMLSSTGHYQGPLERLTVDGETEVPDFSIDTALHSVDLHTKFHAIVDGTSGDTTLDPVQAHMLHSNFTASGTIRLVRENGTGIGHDIDLNVVMNGARIDDMLQLAVKTEPPLMRGGFDMKTRLHIPPGNVSITKKIQLNGNFTVHSAFFSNQSFQEKVDELSMRAQGRPKDANHEDADVVPSTMSGRFDIGNAVINLSSLHYQMPGAMVSLDGQYALDGGTLDLHGDVLTNAKLSQMVSGWKGMALKLADPFFKKDGGGAKIPVKITGTRSEPHFGLDWKHKDQKRDQEDPAGNRLRQQAEDEKKDQKDAAKKAKQQKKEEKNGK